MQGSCKRPNVVYTSINIRKIKFIKFGYIYIHFNQNLDKNLILALKLKQKNRRPIRLLVAMVYFDVI